LPEAKAEPARICNGKALLKLLKNKTENDFYRGDGFLTRHDGWKLMLVMSPSFSVKISGT